MKSKMKPQKGSSTKKGKTDETAYRKEVDRIAREIVSAGTDAIGDAYGICDTVEDAADDLARLPGFDKYVQMLDLVANRLTNHIRRIADWIKEIDEVDASS